jgi:hypothetical protein
MSQFAQEILKRLFESELTLRLEEFALESFKEIIFASLTLYSSSILDRIISEVLSELIPAIAHESHTEVTDSEYIDIRNLIISEVMEEQISLISDIQSNDFIGIHVTEEVISCIELFRITLQTIDEEMKENQSIVFIVADEIIEEFIQGEWIEDIAEIELVQEKMENAWKDMPGHIQREIYLHQKKNIIERLNEMVYFDILNDFVGKLWLEGLVKSTIKEASGDGEIPNDEIFVLKDPNVVIEDSKKAIKFPRKKL